MRIFQIIGLHKKEYTIKTDHNYIKFRLKKKHKYKVTRDLPKAGGEVPLDSTSLVTTDILLLIYYVGDSYLIITITHT